MTTLRGGGGILLPLIVITFLPTCAGGGGGASRTTNGCGVIGLGGCWLEKYRNNLKLIYYFMERE